MKCVIPCAGKGRRMGGTEPKVLIKVNGKTLLQHVMDVWRPVVDGFVLVANPDNEPRLRLYGPTVVQEEQKGLAHAILQAEPLVGERFVVALGDCLLRGAFFNPEPDIGQGYGVWQKQDERLTKLGCAVEVNRGRIVRVVEKPTIVQSEWFCGLSVYFLAHSIFDHIRNTPPSPLRNEVEMSDALQHLIDSGEELKPVWFTGSFINVTYPEDAKLAEEMFK